jgi:hypothetical protein
MENTSLIHPTLPARYQLRLQGRLTADWTDYLSDPICIVEGSGLATITTLTGTVKDQAALFGLLSFIRDLGVVLVSVMYIPETNKKKEAL